MVDFSRICPNCLSDTKDSDGYCSVCKVNAADITNEEFYLPVGYVLLDRYFIGKVIGQGGFGITYLGYDDKFRTKIAVKEYYPHGYAYREYNDEKHSIYSLSGDKAEFFERGLVKFIGEARRLAQFSGAPGIVNVRDFFNENNTAYIIMEFIEGEQLSSVLKKYGKLSETEAAAIFLPIIKTLQRVHAAGILHRDIAPDNIMIEPDGTARLIDFGAAAEIDKEAATSAIVVKHMYVPEEQYDTNRSSQGTWTDVYALSATIFETLEGKTPPESLQRLRGAAFDGFTVPVSQPVKDAVMHGLALFPEDRSQTVDELLAAFSHISAHVSATPHETDNEIIPNSKTEEPQLEELKLEELKHEEPKLEEPKLEEPQLEEPKLEEPKLDEPKLETPQLEEPKIKETKMKDSNKKEQPRKNPETQNTPKQSKSRNKKKLVAVISSVAAVLVVGLALIFFSNALKSIPTFLGGFFAAETTETTTTKKSFWDSYETTTTKKSFWDSYETTTSKKSFWDSYETTTSKKSFWDSYETTTSDNKFRSNY
jgi:serine/threonine protein kinase